MWLLPLLLISLVGTLSGCAARTEDYSFEKAYALYENRLRSAQPSTARHLPPPSMMLGLPPVPQYDQYPARSWEMIRTPSGALYYNYGNGMIQTPHGVELYTIY
jgi:hypothetical protein